MIELTRDEITILIRALEYEVMTAKNKAEIYNLISKLRSEQAKLG